MTREDTPAVVFEDLIADFTIEERREPDLIELQYLARRVKRGMELYDAD